LSRFVLDNTVTMAWCFPEETTPYTEGVLHDLASGGEALVPVLWRYEVVNVLVQSTKRGRITRPKALAFLDDLTALPITVDRDGLDVAFTTVHTLAERYLLTGYDAAYLELALRQNLPLATLDQELITAARAAGVRLLAP
jgi:predicted nucleic acid-binding protein